MRTFPYRSTEVFDLVRVAAGGPIVESLANVDA